MAYGLRRGAVDIWYLHDVFSRYYGDAELTTGPLSERYGRQIVMFSTFAVFTIFNIAIIFSPNYAAFCIFRLIQGICGSSPISVGGGIFADLYSNPVHRGRAMALLLLSTGKHRS